MGSTPISSGLVEQFFLDPKGFVENKNNTQYLSDLRTAFTYIQKELTPGPNLLEIFQGYLKDISEGIQLSFQNGINSMFEGSYLTILSKAVMTLALPVATVSVINYISASFLGSLGKPALMKEERIVHAKDQANKALHDLVMPGVMASLGAFLLSNLPPFNMMLQSVKCALESKLYPDLSSTRLCSRLKYPQTKTILLTALTAGIVTSLVTGVKSFYKERQNAHQEKPEPLPILEPKVQKSLDQIAKTTIDLKERKQFLQNVLFWGVGGTGKTMAAKAIAKNSNMNFVLMSGADLNQHIKNKTHVSELYRLFAKVNSYQGPTVIFIDEAESLCYSREKLRLDRPDYMERLELINTFLNLTGENSKKIMLVLATNRPEDLDPAVLSRMNHKIELTPPGLVERKAILKKYILEFASADEKLAMKQAETASAKTKKLKSDVFVFDDAEISQIAKITEGLTGRALFKLINAIYANKNSSESKKLTKELVSSTVDQFVIQERGILRKLESSNSWAKTYNTNWGSVASSELTEQRKRSNRFFWRPQSRT